MWPFSRKPKDTESELLAENARLRRRLEKAEEDDQPDLLEENGRLRRRVEQLEADVNRMVAFGSPHELEHVVDRLEHELNNAKLGNTRYAERVNALEKQIQADAAKYQKMKQSYDHAIDEQTKADQRIVELAEQLEDARQCANEADRRWSRLHSLVESTATRFNETLAECKDTPDSELGDSLSDLPEQD